MYLEKKIFKFSFNKGTSISEEMVLLEQAPEDKKMVLLKLNICDQKISCKSADFFSALWALRKELEKSNIQILCNGAAKNVYPSPKQLEEDFGRRAYKLNIKKKAVPEDSVNIFDCDDSLNFVDTNEQLKFYDEWKQS